MASHYGASFQRSPKPFAVVGYFYPKGEHGPRQEVYRVEVTQGEYEKAVRRIARTRGTNIDKQERLFAHFKPK